ncbi:MAG: HNH endonuclease [Reyranella sp.]|nr:HNH endonuclease [Reyranella sp.]
MSRQRVRSGTSSSVGSNGQYRALFRPDHPRADTYGYVLEHVLVVETAMGKPLPEKAEVHHINGVPSDNDNSNLVACEDRAYHKLLHRRQRALDACGHADWRKCPYCKLYDDPANMRPHKQKRRAPFYYHLACNAAYRKAKGFKRLARQRLALQGEAGI